MINKSSKKILLIGDSYGAPRNISTNEVELNDTWPILVKNYTNLIGCDCECNFKPFRCLVECVDIIEKQAKKYDLIFIGAGIVDIFPRTLPYHISRSQNILLKIFRIFVRSIRRFWLKYIYEESWFTTSDIETAIKQAMPFCDKLFLLSTPALSSQHASLNPNGQAKINELNNAIRTISLQFENKIEIVDINKIFQLSGDTGLIDEIDSHFTLKGSSIVAQNVIAKIQEAI